MKMQGFIAYEGPSMIDGQPIVVIVTGLARRSKNSKTGAMVQTYILRSDVHPSTALSSGADVSICGDCKFRPHPVTGLRTCYVRMDTPNSVYRAYKRGRYLPMTAEQAADLVRGRVLRCGTYGDPAAAPLSVWIPMVAAARAHTGYTHTWRRPTSAAYRWFLMASCDAPGERDFAHALGWRTFRVMAPNAARLADREISCPASIEAGKVTTCERCKLCAGLDRPAKDIAIVDHSISAMAVRRRSLRVIA